eukprot:2235513-Amphidinium_carterae.2
MADHLHWAPTASGWRQGDQCFTWDEADYKLCKEVADSRPDFQGLGSGLATQALRARCGEAVEDLEHPAWAAEMREVALPASALDAPPCVKLHGLLPAPTQQVVLNHEPALVSRPGVHIVSTDGSGRHSSNPHFRRCGVGCYTDTGESVWMPLPGLKQSVYRAEPLATVRALAEAGRRQPKGRHRDLESRALVALPAGVHIVWMKVHQSDKMLTKAVWNVLICNVTAWLSLRPTEVPVDMCRLSPLRIPKSGSSGALFVRRCLLFGSWLVLSYAFVLSLRQQGQLRFRLLRLPVGLINMWMNMRPTPYALIVNDMWECIRAWKKLTDCYSVAALGVAKNILN